MSATNAASDGNYDANEGPTRKPNPHRCAHLIRRFKGVHPLASLAEITTVIAILGGGPHGHQIASLHPCSIVFDDYLIGYRACSEGALRHEYLIGAVWPQVRQRINDKISGKAFRDGRVVFPGVQLGYSAQLGEHVHVLYNAVVSHGCQIGDFVTICSGAVLAGEVTVEHGAFIGANATIRHGGITIGRNAVVGMGAVVVDDVPDNTKVVGNPAKILVTMK